MRCWWDFKPEQPLWKTVWRFLGKLRIEFLYDPAILFLGIYLKNLKALIREVVCTLIEILRELEIVAALFIIANIWKPPNYPSLVKWMKKKWYIYTVEYY